VVHAFYAGTRSLIVISCGRSGSGGSGGLAERCQSVLGNCHGRSGGAPVARASERTGATTELGTNAVP
jgi:hypothetical protein